MIDPAIWDDPDVGELTPIEFKLFIGCISSADDEGRLEVDPRSLRKQVFGYSEGVSVQDVSDWLDSMAQKLPNVALYDVEDKSYIALLQWKKHQTIGAWGKASVIPCPPGAEQHQGAIEAPSGVHRATIDAPSTMHPSTIDDASKHHRGTIAPIESIESINQESIEQNTTNAAVVADWLQSIQIDEPVRSELASDPRNDLDYLQALWPSAKGRQGLFVSMVRKRSTPPRASPKVGSGGGRYRYASGEYAECIQS